MIVVCFSGDNFRESRVQYVLSTDVYDFPFFMDEFLQETWGWAYLIEEQFETVCVGGARDGSVFQIDIRKS